MENLSSSGFISELRIGLFQHTDQCYGSTANPPNPFTDPMVETAKLKLLVAKHNRALNLDGGIYVSTNVCTYVLCLSRKLQESECN